MPRTSSAWHGQDCAPAGPSSAGHRTGGPAGRPGPARGLPERTASTRSPRPPRGWTSHCRATPCRDDSDRRAGQRAQGRPPGWEPPADQAPSVRRRDDPGKPRHRYQPRAAPRPVRPMPPQPAPNPAPRERPTDPALRHDRPGGPDDQQHGTFQPMRPAVRRASPLPWDGQRHPQGHASPPARHRRTSGSSASIRYQSQEPPACRPGADRPGPAHHQLAPRPGPFPAERCAPRRPECRDVPSLPVAMRLPMPATPIPPTAGAGRAGSRPDRALRTPLFIKTGP